MESQSPEKVDTARRVKPLYWLAAAMMTIAVIYDLMRPPVNWLSIAGRGALIAALVLLATARPVETKGKKLLIYFLAAIALGLLIARLVNRA